jgi:hypothetical protein
MTTRVEGDGVMPGDYKVGIAGDETEYHDARGLVRVRYLTPLKYFDPQTSGLAAKVANRSGETFEFRLERPLTSGK